MKNILHIDASARGNESTTRKASGQIVSALATTETHISYRHANNTLPLLSESMVEAYFTPAEQRTTDQREAIVESTIITNELIAADLIVIGVPIYNFSAPAAFKAWCDLAARVNLTFKYTPEGPVGLLEGKRAIIVLNSGGTDIGGAQDFLTPWLKHFLGFIGISDSTFVTVAELEADLDSVLDKLINRRQKRAA